MAIKIYDRIKLIDKIKRQIVHREIETLKQVKHPNIICLIKTIDTADSLNIVMEYAGKVTLKQYMSKLK